MKEFFKKSAILLFLCLAILSCKKKEEESLPANRMLSGQVLDVVTKNPISGVTITIRSSNNQINHNTTSLIDGRYSFDGLVPSMYTLEVKTGDYEVYTRNVLVKAEESREFEILLNLSPESRIIWWNTLESQWKKAFNYDVFGKGEVEDLPSDKELVHLFSTAHINVSTSPGRSFKLTNLSGVEGFNNLVHFICNNNQISDLTPIQNLIKLETLGCAINQIGDLTPIENLTKLESLTCGNNQISDLTPIQNLNKMRSVNCGHNQISDLSPIQHLTSLEMVTCNNNQISDLTPVQNLIKLEFFTCERNQINDLTPIQNLTKLALIYIRYNTISSLSGLENLNKIENLLIKRGNTIPQTEIERIEALLGITIE